MEWIKDWFCGWDSGCGRNPSHEQDARVRDLEEQLHQLRSLEKFRAVQNLRYYREVVQLNRTVRKYKQRAERLRRYVDPAILDLLSKLASDDSVPQPHRQDAQKILDWKE